MDEKVAEYLDLGKLAREDASLDSIERLLREAVIDLDEAQMTQEIAAHRATFFLSYMAILRAGRALLLLHGYRPANCSQHKTIVEMTIALMGEESYAITKHLAEIWQRQDELVHANSGLLTEREAHDAFHYALLLTRAIVKRVKVQDPEFHVSH